MNVLIITPDAVGSTFLQRLLTIYMQFHEFDRPTINLHELTNGLEKYYNADFNREIISKRKVQSWGYYQSLEQIVTILDSVDHYKTSRLAHYHIKNRQDPLDQQIPFYRYLNDNFFIIACRRHNVFEHALSMSINTITKKLNVYNHFEKLQSFIDIYADNTFIDQRVFVGYLDAYKEYLAWSNQYFNIGSYFHYETHLGNIEQYILDLPVFNGKQKITWEQKFDIDFNDWNLCHHIPSDLGSLSNDELKLLSAPAKRTTEANQTAKLLLSLTQEVSHNIKKEWADRVHLDQSPEYLKRYNKTVAEFLGKKLHSYQSACAAVDRMRQLDIISTPIPIKKQTLSEKMRVIKNFDRCLEIYNDWIIKNPDLGQSFTMEDLDILAQQETQFWQSFNRNGERSDPQANEKLGYQNDVHL